MLKNRGCRELDLQLFERMIGIFIPDERSILLKKLGQWNRQLGITLDEPPVEISKTQEHLDVVS